MGETVLFDMLRQALLISVFPPEKRATALGIWSMTTLVAPIMAMGVTEIRLLMMGIPSSCSICSPVDTRC